MFPSMAALLALVGASAPFALGFDDIKVDTMITAGTDVKVAISNDLHDGGRSYDAQYKNYRVYLSMTILNYDPAPVCYLLNSSRIDVTNFKVNIAASVGPNDSQYSIVVLEFSDNPVQQKDPNNYQYSNKFYFKGGSTMYSQFELDGYVISSPDSIPCSSYDCARQCAQKYFPDNVLSDNGYKKELACLSRCNGVTLSQSDLDFSNSTSFDTTRSKATTGITTGTTKPNSNSTFTIPASTMMPGLGASTPAPTATPSASASSTAAASAHVGTNSASQSMPSLLMMLAASWVVLIAQIWR